MCKCTPEIKTPFCGKEDCKWPLSNAAKQAMNMSKRGNDWQDFQSKVLNHIETYTVPQYGDKGDDIASEYSAKECSDAIKKYGARFGKNSRPGQQALDFLKMAHYAQMGYDALIKQFEQNNCHVCGNLMPCHCNDMEGLG